MTDHDDYPAELAVGVTSSRVTDVSAPARIMHRMILRTFAATGQAPDRGALHDSTPPGHDTDVLLAELHDLDVVRLDTDGHIRAAYPFSAAATRHVVAIEDGPAVYSMCAVDALGIADMLGRDIAITSADPLTGEPVVVTIRAGRAVWSPEAAVVYVGANQPAESIPGRIVAAADRCCTVMNFFTDPATAQQWIDANPTVSGVVLTQGQALKLGVDIFGRLLDE